MSDPASAYANGPFEARYLAFLETIVHLRPSLHRYCSRMTGSVMEGEDLVQDALFQAYRKLDTFDDSRPLDVACSLLKIKRGVGFHPSLHFCPKIRVYVKWQWLRGERSSALPIRPASRKSSVGGKAKLSKQATV